MRRLGAVLAVAVAVWLALRSTGPTPTASDPGSIGRAAPAAPAASAPPAAPAAPANVGGRGFRSPARLAEHFAKHGGEFGAVTMSEYLSMAQALRDAPVGGDVLEVVRPTDGVVSRFDRHTGAFLAADRDGTIRTFFKPNDGEAYFRRQARRPPIP